MKPHLALALMAAMGMVNSNHEPPMVKRKDPSYRNKKARKHAKKAKHAQRSEEELL